MLLFVNYAPWANFILETASVPSGLWLFLLPLGVAMFALEEARKALLRRSLRRGPCRVSPRYALERVEAGLGAPPAISPAPRQAHRRAQFPRLRVLPARNRQRALEIGFCFRRIRAVRPSGVSELIASREP